MDGVNVDAVDQLAELPENVTALLKSPAFAYFATLLPDGSPHLTQTWVDTDGTHILINTVQGYRKLKNLERDGRVALVVSSPADLARHVAIRGQAVSVSTDGAEEHIEALAQRYYGAPYPYHHLGPRVLVRIAPTWVHNSLER